MGACRSEGSLREPGAILLISCYELGHRPVGVALPAALLLQAGYQPAVLDLAMAPLDPEMIRRARFIGISVPMHTAVRIAASAIPRIREWNPRCHLAMYGLYASLNDLYLRSLGADWCISGEYAPALLERVDALEAGGPESGTNHSSLHPTHRPFSVPPDATGLPALDQYSRLEYEGERISAGYVEASRGCLHLCRHCPIPPVYGGRLSVVPFEAVIRDIERQVADGAGHITFGDPDFLNGPGHSTRIVREMHRRWPGLTFDCTVKVEHILERSAVFGEWKASGCLFVISAVESLSDRVLRILRKGHTRADVERALSILDDAGIAMRPTWMPFTPWASLEDYLEIFRFLHENDLVSHVDPVQLTIRLLVPPRSLLLEAPEMAEHLGPLESASFSFRWTHPDPAMDELQQEASRLVERSQDRSPEETFYLLWKVALEREGRGIHPPRARAAAFRKRAPRMTEPWFC